MNPEPRFNCAVDAAMSVIEGRWKTTILCLLYKNGEMRFNEILHAIGEISTRMLSRQLKELESDGVVSRTVEEGSPIKVKYALTERGMSLQPVLLGLAQWGLEHQFSNMVEINTD